ncbi:MAG: hypothetical protein ACJA2W_000854 [Planctomycetota bacterium]
MEADFDPWEGQLDAQHAWRNFGDLTLPEAYEHFMTRPEVFQEDFMFMGCKAFAYYFPVIDRYIRDVKGTEEGDDCSVWILGEAVQGQFSSNDGRLPGSLVVEIEQLSEYVLAHPEQYSPAVRDHRRITRAWEGVQEKVAEHKSWSWPGGAG